MVGLIGNIALPHGHTVDRRTWLEASESGWWYSAVLPGDRMAIAYMTDSDLLPSRSREIGYYANLQLQRTTATLLRVRDCAQPIDFRVVSAASYQVSRVASRSWVAIGDAAMCWDPLSGQGISKALESGIFAATTRHQVSAGNRSALVEYGNWISDEFQHYRRACVHYYRTETRWPDSPFWRRRQRI